jgi:hypothetical protein
MAPSRTEPVLIIVARAEDRLYHYLKRTFADVETIQVLRDRRFKERRRAQATPPLERRQGSDRRCRDISHALAVPGWAMVKQPPAERDLAWDAVLKPSLRGSA